MSLLAKRIPTLVAILVLVLGVGGGIWMVQRQKPKINKEDIKPEKVRITNISDSKFSVSWITQKPVRGKVVYGKMGEKLTKEATDDRDLGDKTGEYTTHHITIAKLQPNTQYAFRIVEEDKLQFDNNGSPYGVKTGPTISQTPTAETIYGVAKKNQALPAAGAIVYVEIPGATPLSTIVKKSGNWTIPISVARTLDLKSYVKYDPTATTFSITITDGKKEAQAKTALKFAKPVPEIVLGKNYEFLAQAETPTPTPISTPSATLAQKEKKPGIFKIEPLQEETASGSGQIDSQVKVIYPEEEETITTNQPEIRGTGPAGLVLSVELNSTVNELDLTDTITIDQDGTWSWIPTQSLEDDNYQLNISYVDDQGNENKITRQFEVNLGGVEPAFEASGGGKKATPSARVTMPATSSGVPVTGMWEQTVLTLLAGFGIMMLGGWLLKAGEYE